MNKTHFNEEVNGGRDSEAAGQSETTGAAVSSSTPTLQSQRRKSHLKASPGGSCGGVGGVLGHLLNCLSKGTPASCLCPRLTGVWVLKAHPLFLLFYCNCQCRRHKKRGFDPWIPTVPCRRAWQPTPVFLPGESHG